MTEEDAIDIYARSVGVNSEMFGRVGGDQALWLGANPRDGWIYLVRVEHGIAYELARWTCVQGENLQTLHARAISIVESGIGSMR